MNISIFLSLLYLLEFYIKVELVKLSKSGSTLCKKSLADLINCSPPFQSENEASYDARS